MLRAAYTYLNSEDKSDSGKDELQYRPKNRFSFEGKYDFDFGLTPYVSVLYVADQYFYSNVNKGPLLKGTLNNYTLVNVKLNQKLLEGKMNLYVGADNLFDENYETSYGFPQPGRFIYGGIEICI
jgi:outer membrane receptor protein involved in Fe transport